MANYETGQAILADVLERTGEPSSSSDFEAEAKRIIQAVYLNVVGRYPWPWAKKNPPGILNTVAEVTGTVSVTNNSTSITFSAAVTPSMAARKFLVDDDGTVYRIATHTSGQTAATLDSAYLGTTNAAATYRIFQDEYDLDASFLSPVNKDFLVDCQRTRSVDLVGEGQLRASYPYAGRQGGFPDQIAFIGDLRVRFAPAPIEARRYEYTYIYHPGVLTFDGVGGTDTPIIKPAEDRVVIALYAIANIFLDKNDDRAGSMGEAAQGKLASMVAAAVRKGAGNRLYVRSQFNVSTRR